MKSAVPRRLDGREHLTRAIRCGLRGYGDEMVDGDGFAYALDFSVAGFDELARLTDIQVTGAEASDVGVAVHYIVHWEAFHACDDKWPYDVNAGQGVCK